jgi:hypothetical protein
MSDDIKVLQKAFVDLDLAKAVAINVQNQFKYRTKLLKHKSVDKAKQVCNIRECIDSYILIHPK